MVRDDIPVGAPPGTRDSPARRGLGAATDDEAAWPSSRDQQPLHDIRSLPSLTGTSPALELDHFPDDPLDLFAMWLAQAVDADVPEPHAMTLSTVDDDGLPDARTSIPEAADQRGRAFASTASSARGHQLAARPQAATSSWWQPIARAARLRGRVEVGTRADSEADLAARSAAARAGEEATDCTLWRLHPSHVEFWQAAADRRHLRVGYARPATSWDLSVRHGEHQDPR